MSPLEKNTRKLIGVMAEFFPHGSNCEDLRSKFETIANRKAATFFACLAYAKSHGWIIAEGGPLRSVRQVYSLNPNGCWRPPPIGEGIERHQFEHVLETRTERIEKLEATNRRLTDTRKAIAAGEAAGTAIGTLVEIMSDPAVTIRGRLAAAENLLAYKTPPAVAEAAKLFLATVFLDKDQPLDHRLAATTALRKSEDVRLMPPIERPPPPVPPVDPVKAAAEREATHLRRRQHIERQAQLDAERLAQERLSGKW
jgi:hypothetical protein